MEFAPRGAWSFASRVRPSGPLQATCHLYRTSGHSSEPRRATRPSIELVSMIAASWWPFISPWCRRMTPLASTRWVTEPSSPTERNVSCTSTSRVTHADQVLAHARSGGHLHAAASVEVALQARVSLVDRLCGAGADGVVGRSVNLVRESRPTEIPGRPVHPVPRRRIRRR